MRRLVFPIIATLAVGCLVDSSGGLEGSGGASATSGTGGVGSIAVGVTVATTGATTTGATTTGATTTGATTTSGVGGSGGGPPSQETCNGLDDDQDGTADDGCPETIQLGANGYSNWVGIEADNNTESDGVCPVGQAVTRLQVHYSSGGFPLRQFRFWCAPLELVVDMSVDPYVYSVEAAPIPGGATYEESWGSEVAIESTANCGPKTFGYGVSIYSHMYGPNGITLHCSSLSLSGTPDAGFSFVRVGNNSGYIGPSGGVSPIDVIGVDANDVLTGFAVRTSDIGNGPRLRAMRIGESDLQFSTIQ